MTKTFPASTLTNLLAATSEKDARDFLATLQIVSEDDYTWSKTNPSQGWQEGKLHWVPVGLDFGNMGHIKLAGSPENPLAERIVNGMEALIELERRRELSKDPTAAPPSSPKEAALRYFKLPPLDTLPKAAKQTKKDARLLAKRLRLRLVRTQKPVEHAVIIEDDGIGQQPRKLHSTILSLGSSDKADKRYMIGVFGHGGSSAFEASKISIIVSRRAPGLESDQDDGFGWTLVRQVFRKGRRDSYWAYLAATPDGQVPRCDAVDDPPFAHGTRITHLNYNFGQFDPTSLYGALNHLLFKPVLPYEISTKKPGDAPDPMWGNGYRLARLTIDVEDAEKDLDKSFAPQKVTGKAASGGEES